MMIDKIDTLTLSEMVLLYRCNPTDPGKHQCQNTEIEPTEIVIWSCA